MHTNRTVVKMFVVAMLASVAIPVLAESAAPVFDADAMQQPYDNGGQQDLPPPPPPQEGAFIPGNPSPSVSSSSATTMQTESQSFGSSNIDQRVKRVEQQVANMQDTKSTPRVETLEGEVQSLRDQVEKLTHKLEQAEAAQKMQYSDLDKRLANNAKPTVASTTDQETAATPAPDATKAKKATKGVTTLVVKSTDTALDNAKPASSTSSKTLLATNTKSTVPATVDQPNVAEEQQVYQTAYNLIKAKKYDQAVTTLQEMLKKYPTGQFASNAHYWLGELYGLLGKHEESLVEFNSVVKNYPQSPRVSDAMLKVGLIYATEPKWPDAKAALKKVINRYPGTASARLASEQLKQIKQAGH